LSLFLFHFHFFPPDPPYKEAPQFIDPPPPNRPSLPLFYPSDIMVKKPL